MSKTLNSRIIIRNDTRANWESNDPILLKGEFGVESDSTPTLFKIGNGVNTWTNLSYAGADVSSIQAQISNMSNTMNSFDNSLNTFSNTLNTLDRAAVKAVSINGTPIAVQNNLVNIPVPTKTSDLTNDGDGESAFATRTYVSQSISGLGTVFSLKGTVENIANLPSNASAGDVYLVGLTTDTDKEEYVRLSNATWEKLGTVVNIDMSNYLTIAQAANTYIAETDSIILDGGTSNIPSSI